MHQVRFKEDENYFVYVAYSHSLYHRPEGAQVPLQGGFPANMPPHPVYMPMQMLWWQQMYARQYYMQ